MHGGYASRIEREVGAGTASPSAPHRFGGVELRLGRRELGHLHGDALADLPFPRRIADMLVETGRAERHHVLPDSGWVTRQIRSEEDVDEAIELFRLAYERAQVAPPSGRRARSRRPGSGARRSPRPRARRRRRASSGRRRRRRGRGRAGRRAGAACCARRARRAWPTCAARRSRLLALTSPLPATIAPRIAGGRRARVTSAGPIERREVALFAPGRFGASHAFASVKPPIAPSAPIIAAIAEP